MVEGLTGDEKGAPVGVMASEGVKFDSMPKSVEDIPRITSHMLSATNSQGRRSFT